VRRGRGKNPVDSGWRISRQRLLWLFEDSEVDVLAGIGGAPEGVFGGGRFAVR